MSTEQLIEQAEFAIREGNLAQARSLLRQVIGSDPRNFEAWLLLAQATTDKNLAGEYAYRAQWIQASATPGQQSRDSHVIDDKPVASKRAFNSRTVILVAALVLIAGMAAVSYSGRAWEQSTARQNEIDANLLADAPQIQLEDKQIPQSDLLAAAEENGQIERLTSPDPEKSAITLYSIIIPTDEPPLANGRETGSAKEAPTAGVIQFEPAIISDFDAALPAAILSGIQAETSSDSSAENNDSSENSTTNEETSSEADTQFEAKTDSADATDVDETTETTFDESIAEIENELQDLAEFDTAAVVEVASSEILPQGVSMEEHWIDVNLTTQTLVAYEGETPVLNSLISSGMWQFPTVTGQYQTWMKHETQNMSGFHLGYNYYLENVPDVMYFFEDYAIHGAYWHNNFGTPMSHGCVNMNTVDSDWLFDWAPLGTVVNIHY